MKLEEDSSSYSSVAQSGHPSTPSVGLPSESRQNNPFLQFMTVPPGDIPLQMFNEGQTSMSSTKRDKVPATTETTPMQASYATTGQYTSTSKLPGK
jgi:hypothetical protein